MNPLTLSASIKLAKAEDFPGIFIAPPSIFLAGVKENIHRASLAAQDVGFPEAAVGTFTGENSAAMLKKLGVKLVIVGHSERRALGETDAQISKKIKAVLAAGLKAVLCVGEPMSVRQKGLPAVKKFLEKQLSSSLFGIENWKLKIENSLIIAYEPIWAIGSGHPATPKEAVDVSVYLKKFLNLKFKIENLKFIYGGSVSAGNAKEFLAKPEIDGLLVGGLSLKPKEFKKCV